MWAFPESTPGSVFHQVGASFTLKQWHAIEYEADRSNGRIRFWYDGAATMPVPYKNSNVTTDGNWLVLGQAQDPVFYMTWMNTINYVTALTGACYFDRLAVSTLGRIGA